MCVFECKANKEVYSAKFYSSGSRLDPKTSEEGSERNGSERKEFRITIRKTVFVLDSKLFRSKGDFLGTSRNINASHESEKTIFIKSKAWFFSFVLKKV